MPQTLARCNCCVQRADCILTLDLKSGNLYVDSCANCGQIKTDSLFHVTVLFAEMMVLCRVSIINYSLRVVGTSERGELTELYLTAPYVESPC